MQRVHHPGDRHRTRGRDQRLGQHLATEDPLQQGVGLPRPEQVDLDLLEIEQIDQLIHRLRHGASLATDLRWTRAQGPRASFAAVGSPHSGGGRGHRRPGHGPIPAQPRIRPRRRRATAHLVPRGRRHLPPGQRGPSPAVVGSGGRGGRTGRADQPPTLRRSSRPGAVRGRRGRSSGAASAPVWRCTARICIPCWPPMAPRSRCPWARPLREIHQQDGTATAVFDDGSTGRYDLIIGADGIHSTVRAALLRQSPAAQPVGRVAWRFVTGCPADLTAWTVMFGRDVTFLAIPLGGGRAYCYVDSPDLTPAGTPPVEQLHSMLADFAEPVPSLLEAARCRRPGARRGRRGGQPDAIGSAAPCCWSGMPPTRRRPTWPKARPWRSRTRSSWRNV